MIPNMNINKLSEWAENQFELGVQTERKRILTWINQHRTYTELEAGIGVYRDHFSADDLLNFIMSKEV